MIALDRGPSRVKDLDSEFGELMEDARYGVLAVDQQDCIFFANRRMEAMCGSSLAELMHRPIEVLVPRSPRAVHRRKWVEYQAIGAPVRPMGTNLDIRFQRQDGSEFPADVALIPMDTPTGERMVIAAVSYRSGCQNPLTAPPGRLAVIR